MFFLRIADIIGIVISIIYYFFLFLKLHKGDNGPWVRIIALTLIGIITILLTFLISSRSNINPTENIIIGSFLTVECFAILVDSIFFMKERVKKKYDFYRAKSCLEDAGVTYDNFAQLSYYDQVKILRNTPYPYGDDDGMLVEDDDDLEKFRCIMKKEPKK